MVISVGACTWLAYLNHEVAIISQFNPFLFVSQLLFLCKVQLSGMSGVGFVLSVAYGSTHLKPLVAASPPPVRLEERSFSDTLEVADKLYGENKMKEALAYLERCSDSPEAEILWRLARLSYKVSVCMEPPHPPPSNSIQSKGLAIG